MYNRRVGPGRSARDILLEAVNAWNREHEAATYEGVLQVDLTGADPVRAHLVVGAGPAQLKEGAASEPTASLSIAVDDLVAHDRGSRIELPGPAEVSGEPGFALRFLNMFQRPGAATVRRFHRLAEHAARAGRRRTIERLQDPPLSALIEALIDNRPIVISGYLDRWRVGDWSFERLTAEYGGHALDLARSPARTLGEFLAQVTSGAKNAYSHGCSLPPGLEREFECPRLARDALLEPQLWLGRGREGGVTGMLHRDDGDSLLCQVIGGKRFLLYSPDQAEDVYPLAHYGEFQPCWAQPWAPDYARHPRLKRAEPIDVELRPGDLLLLACGWFHVAFAPEPTMSISFFVEPNRVYPDHASPE